MPYRKLNFDDHNQTVTLLDVQQMFRMHFERGGPYQAKQVYQQILAVGC
jgi:hypothetical protein